MPDNKPLSNSLLIKREISSRVNFAQDSIPNWQGDPLNLQAIIYDWFVIRFRYPVLKIIEASLLKENKILQSYQVACAVATEALEKLTDDINEEHRARNALAEFPQGGCAQKVIDYKLTINGRNVNFTYSLSNDADLHFILSNSSGMVYRSNAKKLAKGEGYQQSFDCAGLPSGEYVLYIQVNQQIYSEKLGLK